MEDLEDAQKMLQDCRDYLDKHKPAEYIEQENDMLLDSDLFM